MGQREEILSFDEFLARLREASQNKFHQGRQFEQAMVALLPQHHEYQFDEAWLWQDWPDRKAITGLSKQDTGIDIVARLGDEYWAIQCKFHDPSSQINLKELGTFFTTSGREGFSRRLIITTTDNWTKHADKMIEGQQIKTHRLRLKDLQEFDIDWNWAHPDKTKLKTGRPKKLYPLQEKALNEAKSHFAEHERGQLIMACGTGKTFTSLKIAEALTPEDGYVLFVVPSLSLMRQTISEWAGNRIPNYRDHRYLAICSDSTVGKDEDATILADLPVPVFTNPNRIVNTLNYSKRGKDKTNLMNVVFCTYQSLDQLNKAQDIGAPSFDLIICDEAHRTTGVDKDTLENSNRGNSNFVKIHDNDFIRGEKRLYMTATPRIYTDAARTTAKENNIGIFSMDDESEYGEEFYRLGFSKAVEKEMLSDYKVIVLTIAQDYIAKMLNKLDKETIEKLDPTTDDAAKIIGCYKALRDQGEDEGGKMLKRAVSFSNTIKNSEMVVEKFQGVVEALDELENDGFTCQLDHVDGKQSTLERAKKLDWLKDNVPANEDGEMCRILSNARCLTEGVDVPSLDAILFMNPRKSQVDVVQAVGRVMRKAKGKDYGYVILPVVIPTGEDIESALDNNKVFDVVWQVLRALRAHDDRLIGYMEQLKFNETKPENVKVIGIGFEGENGADDPAEKLEADAQLKLIFPQEYTDMIHAKIVDKVGDRLYYENWAKDTAKLHDSLVRRIDELRGNKPDIQKIYGNFLSSIQASINDGLNEADATSMLAQQLITRPIFDTLFEGYQFSQNNVVSQGLDNVLNQLNEYGLDKELEKLQAFYDSVKNRVANLDNDEARQRVITELYENFFTTAFKKTAEKLGISYTPIELVDFILKSADDVMRAEFGRGLTDKDVHIIDPFTGTGSFLVRLLTNPDLIKEGDLARKFTKELWANEFLLLAYYIAAVNIEMTYHQRSGGDYQPFAGISLTDTFELSEGINHDISEVLGDNNKRIEAQRKAPIRVVVGNPPWSVGQKSANDDNANRTYPKLNESIRSTYAKRSKTTSNKALRDSYIRAIRWASDRIGDEGIVAYITNAGWLEGNSTSGVRLCLEDEFDTIHLFNLRGDARLKGEAWRKEGDKIFGQASRVPVVISLFVKNPNNKRQKAEIHYHDIGNYLSRDKKFDIIRKAGSITGLDCKTITPNAEGDWLNLRDPAFQNLVELGNEDVKEGRISSPQTIFRSYSLGINTNRDAWAYNFSRDKVSQNMSRMIETYNEQRNLLAKAKVENPKIDPNTILDMNPTRIKWSSSLIPRAERNLEGKFDEKNIRPSLYRPFNKEHHYMDWMFNHRTGKMFDYFPKPDSENRLICATSKGAKGEFSCLMVDTIPEVQLLTNAQNFPRWVYRQDDLTGEFIKEDNITAHALDRFQTTYKDANITKDDIFNYIYGILHARDYCKHFEIDLRLDLPRIPMAKDFWAFANAGEALADYHLNWQLDGTPEYTTELSLSSGNKAILPNMIPAEAFEVKKMAWKKQTEAKFITYNQHFDIGPIPEEALKYTISDKTPLQWLIDRYQFKVDTKTKSGITNDPNDWIAEQGRPDALVELIKRVTFLSIETQKIIDGLPKAVDDKK